MPISFLLVNLLKANLVRTNDVYVDLLLINDFQPPSNIIPNTIYKEVTIFSPNGSLFKKDIQLPILLIPSLLFRLLCSVVYLRNNTENMTF